MDTKATILAHLRLKLARYGGHIVRGLSIMHVWVMRMRARVGHLMWLVPCQHCIHHEFFPLMLSPTCEWVTPTHCCKPNRQHQSQHDEIHTSSMSNLAVLTLPQVFLSRDTGLMFIPAERHRNRHRSAHCNIPFPVRGAVSLWQIEQLGPFSPLEQWH